MFQVSLHESCHVLGCWLLSTQERESVKLAHNFCELSERAVSVASIFRKQNTYPERSEQELLVSLLVFPPTAVTLVWLLESGPASEGRTVLE